MRNTFMTLAAICFLAAFFTPLSLIAAGAGIVCLVIGIGCAPEGRRADGKRRTGGLLGGVWDAAMESYNTKKCPFCGERILREAKVCRYCGRDLPQGEQNMKK